MKLEDLLRRAEEISTNCRGGVYVDPSDVADEYMMLIRSYVRAFRPLPTSIRQVEVAGMRIAISDHARGRLSERIPGSKRDKVEAIRRAVSRCHRENGHRREAISDGGRWIFEDSTGGDVDMVLVTVVPE